MVNYSYDRTRTAGRNGELRLTGASVGTRKSSGGLYYLRPITMPPRFVGKDLDSSIGSLGKGFMETILRNVMREVPNLKVGAIEGFASHQNTGLFLGAEVRWSLLTNAQALVSALEKISDPLGFTFVNDLA